MRPLFSPSVPALFRCLGPMPCRSAPWETHSRVCDPIRPATTPSRRCFIAFRCKSLYKTLTFLETTYPCMPYNPSPGLEVVLNFSSPAVAASRPLNQGRRLPPLKRAVSQPPEPTKLPRFIPYRSVNINTRYVFSRTARIGHCNCSVVVLFAARSEALVTEFWAHRTVCPTCCRGDRTTGPCPP